MIYSPIDVFDLREATEGGLIRAGLAAFEDFIVGENKPWTFYAGVALGSMAAATGIPGASVTLYVIGDSVDAVFFKSPDGSDVRIFLNGIAHSALDTYAVSYLWESVNIAGLVGGQVNRLDIVNYGPSANEDATGILWFGMSDVTVNGENGYIYPRSSTVATFNVSYSILDGDGDTSALAFKVPAGTLTLAQITGYAQQMATLLDAVIGGKILGIGITLDAALPGGLKAAATATSDVQEGALFTFTTATPYVDSVRVPAWLETLFTGKEVNLAGTGVGAFRDGLLNGIDVAGTTVAASDRYENDYTSLKSSVKSFRKK
jgi:hypothetical protein